MPNEQRVAKAIANGDRVRLRRGLTGVVFSHDTDEDGLIQIFIETDSGGMQSAGYKPDEDVEIVPAAS